MSISFEKKNKSNYNFLINEKNANIFCNNPEIHPNAGILSYINCNNSLIMKIDNKIIGFISFKFIKRWKIFGGNYIYIDIIGTMKNREEINNIKIGSELLKIIEKIAIYNKIYLLKGITTNNNINFYEKYGWTINYVNGKMKKKLYKNI